MRGNGRIGRRRCDGRGGKHRSQAGEDGDGDGDGNDDGLDVTGVVVRVESLDVGPKRLML